MRFALARCGEAAVVCPGKTRFDRFGMAVMVRLASTRSDVARSGTAVEVGSGSVGFAVVRYGG